MKAVEITSQYTLSVTRHPQPAPQSGEVLLRIAYAGFCGSDLNTWRGLNAMATFPRIPGHEIGATVETLGPDMPADLPFKVGDIVTVNPYTACGHCAACRRGRSNACENNETLGVQRNGAMQEWVTLPWTKVIPVEGVSLRDCALIEPMSVGFHAVSRGQVTADDTVMVIGCGMVGLGAVVAAAERGAKVIAADIDDDKLALARLLGATYTLNTLQPDAAPVPEPDVVVEAVGSAPTYRMAVDKVAFTGRVVCIGYAKQDIALTTQLFVKKELDIRGSRNATPADFASVIRYLQRGNCPTDRLISAVVPPEDAATAMQQWHASPGKVFRILVRF